MKTLTLAYRPTANNIIAFAITLCVTLSLPTSDPWAQSDPIKNDRILAPEVSHFARIPEPGVDAHGDLSLSIPLMTIPGRDGLSFDIVAHYRSGIQVTQSASWIGLGWELDVGSITRSSLGGLDRGSMADGNSEHVDWSYALSDDPSPSRRIDSQPDVYMVNLAGNSTLLYSMTLENNPSFPFAPAANPVESGLCFQGQNPTSSRYYFVPAPWRPWKFCYATANPVTVDGQSTGFAPNSGNRQDFSKFSITTEDGTRYIFGQPTLSDAFFPLDDVNPSPDVYNRFVSTWRLTAILSPNYSYAPTAEVPDSSSPGGWIKLTYQTLNEESPYTPKTVDTIQNTCCDEPHLFAQMTYPYRIDTPTHYAIFETKWRYDRDLAFEPDAPQRIDFNRLLDKIKLYRRVDGGSDQLITEVSFTYLDNGALALNTPINQTQSMLSKLALEKITIKGLQGPASDSLPSYKFSYYDINKSWYDITHQLPSLMEFQDDFGYYDSNSSGASTIPDTDRPMWSLKEITYPDGGRHFITYKSDSLNGLGLTYNKYLYSPVAPTYTSNVPGNFQSLRQGGARVKSITTYDGYASSGSVVNFSYGPGRHWSIPEIWFRRNAFPNNLLFSSGERGQSAVTYDWIEKILPDGSRIKTFYETGDGSPEPQMLFSYVGGSPAKFAVVQGNSRWNWGEINKIEYFDSNPVLVKRLTNIWTFRGHVGDATPIKIATVAPRLPYGSDSTNAVFLNFTHKELELTLTHDFFASGAVSSSETFDYVSGTLLFMRRETSGDGKIRVTEHEHAFEQPGETYFDMKLKNMRSQIAQTSVKNNSGDGYSSIITTWKEQNGKHLPDQEFRWRNSTTAAAIPSFNWTMPSETNGWILTQTFDQYDQHGNLISVKDANNIATSIFWDNTGTLIDSIQSRPNATTMLTTKYGYDPNTFRLTSITDPSGQKTQYKYDPLQRLIETIMPDKRTAGDLSYYYSRQGAGNNDTFNPFDPNYIRTRSLSGPGFFEPFEYTDAPENHGWGIHYGAGKGTMSTVYDNALQSQVMRIDVNPGYGNQDYAVRYPATGNWALYFNHLWVKTKSTAGTSSFRIIVSRGGVEYALRYYLNSGTSGYDPVTRFVTIFVGAEFNDGNWHAFERDLEQDFKMTALPTGYDFIKRIVAVGEYDFDDIQLLNHPVTTLTFADGLGRDIQTLQYDQAGSIKSGTFYDALDRVIKVTKPFFHANSQFTRVDSVIAYANAYYAAQHPVYYNGSAQQEFDTGNYAYAETEYYPDPLNRVRHQYAPGTVFSRADTNYVKYRYGTNAANEMGITNAGSVFETRIFDENDVKTEIFTDTFGNKIGVRNDSSGIDDNGNSSKLATGFQYDITGNLLKIAPPKAFKIANNNIPDWNSVWCTSMAYDTWGLLRKRNTPDAGTDSMHYDKKGNLRFVKDAKGAASNYFIYYKYDNLNRKIEEGVMRLTSPTNFKQSNADNPTYPSPGDTVKAKYQYDVTTYTASAPQRNLKGRLDGMEYLTDRYPNSKGFVFYSYDANGNLEWIEQTIPRSNISDGNGYLIVRIDYQYDALGKVTKTYLHRTFPPGGAQDAFYVWYDYDALGRLESVRTSTVDFKPTPTDARYTYWPGGQVRRLVLRETLQGLDYLYNSRDWLSQINSFNLFSNEDPGGDGGGNGVSVDKFGQVIGYDLQKHIGFNHSDFGAQYNGNISWTIHKTATNLQPVGAALTGWVFKYDKANRLTKANWGHWNSGWQTSNRYDLTGFVYDRHGNLEYMNRYDQNNAVTNMNYIYQDSTNKLLQVDGLPGQNSNNYVYDANGNMIQDIAKLGQNSTISYDYRNLPTKVPINGNNIDFGYDGKGQRVSKNNLFYVPGADGKFLAVYDSNGTLLYWNIWGLDLIGQRFWKQ